MPRLVHIASLWSLTDYPDPARPWSLEKQLDAVQEAGFEGFTASLSPAHGREAARRGLRVIGHFSGGDPEKFEEQLKVQQDAGARHVNVHLADHDTPTETALRLALRLFDEAASLGDGLEPAIETHRDTCTGTPEKTYALADAYRLATGSPLPMTWDHSHLAVVKHLTPGNFAPRLLGRPELVARAQQFHLRPFNGHHCQVPVSNADGTPARELRDWLPFAEALMRQWLTGHRDPAAAADREFFAVPEMGPAADGYGLHALPNAWEEARRLRPMLAEAWAHAVAATVSP